MSTQQRQKQPWRRKPFTSFLCFFHRNPASLRPPASTGYCLWTTQLQDLTWDIDEGRKANIERVIGILQFRRTPWPLYLWKLSFIIVNENWRKFAASAIGGAPTSRWAHSKRLLMYFPTACRTLGLHKKRWFHWLVSVTLAQNSKSFLCLSAGKRFNSPRTSLQTLLQIYC